MFKSAVGSHSGTDGRSTGITATTEALQALGIDDALASAAFVFVAPTYDANEVLDGVRSILGEATPLIGASTAGEIANEGPTIRDSVVVLVFYSDTVTFTSASHGELDVDAHAAGVAVAETLQAEASGPLQLALIDADGLRGNGSAVIRGMLEVLGDNFPIAGGSAGDGGKFVATEQLHNGSVMTNSVAAMGLSGSVAFSVGINHGWNPVGAPRRVTSVDGVRVQTIDDKPALDLYETYLGADEVKNLKTSTLGEMALSYPLGVRDEQSGEYMLRAPLSVGEDGSIVCGGEVTMDSEVQLMVGTKEDAVAAATKAAEQAQSALGKPAQAAIIYSCHVRNTLFATNEQARAETDAIRAVIGADVPMAGFYTYAEQAPYGGSTRNINKCNPQFHNETVVIVLLAEGDTK